METVVAEARGPLLIHDNHRNTVSTEQDIESGQKPSSSLEDASHGKPSKDEIELKRKKLQALIYTLGAGISSNVLGVGIFAYVYDLGDGRVRKLPDSHPGNLDLALLSIRRERDIYAHLGAHPRVVKCLAAGDLFVDLEFAPNGHLEDYLKRHLEDYLKRHPDTSPERRVHFAREAIEAVAFIHSKGVIHSDLAARQFLLDAGLHVRLCDFGFSRLGGGDGGDVLGFENPSHHLPRDLDAEVASSVRSDLFALGSTLYEVVAGKRPYEGREDEEIGRLYGCGEFPDVAEVLGGGVIVGCWRAALRARRRCWGISLLSFLWLQYLTASQRRIDFQANHLVRLPASQTRSYAFPALLAVGL